MKVSICERVIVKFSISIEYFAHESFATKVGKMYSMNNIKEDKQVFEISWRLFIVLS